MLTTIRLWSAIIPCILASALAVCLSFNKFSYNLSTILPWIGFNKAALLPWCKKLVKLLQIIARKYNYCKQKNKDEQKHYFGIVWGFFPHRLCFQIYENNDKHSDPGISFGNKHFKCVVTPTEPLLNPKLSYKVTEQNIYQITIPWNKGPFPCMCLRKNSLVVHKIQHYFAFQNGEQKAWASPPAQGLPLVLSSVPASQEVGSVGDCVSSGSGSGGANCGSDLCHSHRQRACCWILSWHHCEWHLKHFMAVTHCVLCFSVFFFLCLQLSFGAFLGIVGIHLVENRRPMVSLLFRFLFCFNALKSNYNDDFTDSNMVGILAAVGKFLLLKRKKKKSLQLPWPVK